MSVVEVLREYSEVWKLFGQMPDSATVNSELASVFLGISIKTLARYRQNGEGHLISSTKQKIRKREISGCSMY